MEIDLIGFFNSIFGKTKESWRSAKTQVPT